jgi:hypothetical protein
MKMVGFTLYGVQEDLMQNPHPTNRFKNHTKPEEKNMSPWEFMGLLLEWIGILV